MRLSLGARVGVAVAFVVAVVAPPTPGGAQDTPSPGAPTGLTVDGLTNPVGIDDTPQFAWRVNDPSRGAVQSGYRVLVGTTPAAGRDDPATVWDSGEVPSARQAFVAYGGPPLASDATYWWTVQTVSGTGAHSPFAAAVRFDTGLHDGDWRAQWIRRSTTDAVDQSDDYTYARKEATLAASPIVRAVAYVSADHQYQLWINGARLDAGEAFSYPDAQYYQATDVTAALRAGAANAIGVLYHWYGLGKGRPEGASGVVVQLSIMHADGTSESVLTDGSWRVARAEWLPATQRNTEMDPVDYTEHINGPAHPTGWDRPGFDATTWTAAVALGTPPTGIWTHLLSVRTRIVETKVAPVSVTQLSNGAFVADFGQVIAAVPSVAFHQGLLGRAVTMHAGYLLDAQPSVGASGQVSTTSGTQHTDMSYAYVQRGGDETFRSFDYLGFRYLQIDSPGETLTAGQIVAYARHASEPDEAPATFASSNPTVDAVFRLAQHSAMFGSQEQFIDTPTREKGPFLRDGFNISETAMRAFDEQNLSRRALLEFAQSQLRYWSGEGRMNAIYPSGQGKRDIPDFTEIYPDWVWRYYLNTGDDDAVAQLYPVARAIADYLAAYTDPNTGLVTNLAGGDGDYQYGIVDWPKNMRYGYDMATVVRTTVNLLAVDVFDRVVALADALGRPSDEIDGQRARRDALVAAINAHLRRADGIYVDGLEADGSLSPHASQHANAYALAYGVAPPDSVDAIGTYVAGQGMAMGPQTAQELLAALHRAGRDADLVSLLSDPSHDGWANILAAGGTFTWETWEPSDSNGDSMSHGWGSTVLVEIIDSLLGVTCESPSCARIEVRPPTAGVDHAEGSMPTVRGAVSASWSRPADASGTFDIAVTVPPNMHATVRVPALNVDGVTESGQPVADATGVRVVGIDGDFAVLDVGAGDYTFSSSDVPARFVGLTATGSPGTPGVGVPAPDGVAAATVGNAVRGATSSSSPGHRDHAPLWLVVLLAGAQVTLMVFVWRSRALLPRLRGLTR